VHGDPSPANVVFGADGSWLIDFEHMGTGPVLVDVARAMLSLVGHPEARDDFLAGYRAASLIDAELFRLGVHECLPLAAGLIAQWRLDNEARAPESGWLGVLADLHRLRSD
jgi:Ser/Thr protein kinase RdoA (MazF antagonist)